MSVAQHTAAELVHSIFDLQRALRGVMAATTKVADLGQAQASVLFCISEGSPMRASTLAGRLGVGASTLSRQLADLERAHFVIRTPDPEDGRASLLTLSEEGQQYLTETYEQRAATLREILAGWTEGEAEAAASSVQQLTTALRSATRTDTGPPGVGSICTIDKTGIDGRQHLDIPSDTMKEDH